MSIGRIFFICFILTIGSYVFAYDAQNLVLIPIERIIEKVKILSKDPIAAAKQDPNNEGILSKVI